MSRTAHKLLSASGGGVDAYEIDQSLMFNSADTAYLKRTPSSAGNRRTFTLSAWVKLTQASSDNSAIFACSTAGNDASTTYISIYQGKLQYQGYNTNYRVTNKVFRDVGAWYHFVWAVDTTIADGSADNRIRLYVNGVEETSFGTKNNPSQNYDFIINSTNEHQLGDEGATTAGISPFDGYMAEVNFIDGTQLTPSSFGETDAATGQWIPKEITGLTYGTNGFYLPFKNSSKYSAYFNGTNSALTTADHTDFTLGTNNFTIECWFNLDETANTDRYFTGITNSTGADANTVFYINVVGSTKKISCYFFDSSSNYYSVNGNIVITPGKWHHFAFVRNGNVFTVYIDGVSNATRTEDVTMKDSANNLSVGRAGEVTASWHNAWKGWISDFTLVNGTAVYTSAFTPSTTSLTAITNTKLLCCNHATVTTESSGTSKTLTITTANSVYSDLVSPFEFNYFSDQSGQENDFIGTNLITSDVLLDTPTNNFSTLNGIQAFNTTIGVLTQGNLFFAAGAYSSGNYSNISSTFNVPASGKWYAECRISIEAGGGNVTVFGVTDQDINWSGVANENLTGMDGFFTSLYSNYIKVVDSGSVGTGNTSATATSYILGMALDVDNGYAYFGVDSGSAMVWYKADGSTSGGDPTSGSTGTGGFARTFTIDDTITVSTSVSSSGGDGSQNHLNFGQNGTFSGTETAGGNADGNGEGNFFRAPPSGFKALCSKNLPTPAIKKSTDHFNTVLYTGNGSTQSITGVGHQPDWVWIKNRSAGDNHKWTDVVRGVTKEIESNTNDIEATNADGLTAFGSDGFSLGDDDEYNTNTETYVSWNWKASNSSSSNEDGSINTTATSVNTTSGFSVSTYTGTGSNATVGHGLGVAPSAIIIKNRGVADDWAVYSRGDATDYLELNTTNATADDNTYWNDTAPTSSVFSIGTAHSVNASSETYVAYCFANVEGFFKSGTYTGNGAAENGPFIHTGFKPKFVIVKKASASGSSWFMWDSVRHPANVIDLAVWADANNGDTSHAEYEVDFLSNGFKIRGQNAGSNASGETHIYMAWAESPFKYATAR